MTTTTTSISELVRKHSTNPHKLVILLDTQTNPHTSLQLYQEGNKANILRPIDQTYLSQYAEHPNVKQAATNYLQHNTNQYH